MPASLSDYPTCFEIPLTVNQLIAANLAKVLFKASYVCTKVEAERWTVKVK